MIRTTVIKNLIKYYNHLKLYDRIKQIKPMNIFSLLIKLILGRFVLFIFKSIFNYTLSLPLYDGLLLVIWFLSFIIYIIIRFNVVYRINNIYKALCKLYNHDKKLFILLLPIVSWLCHVLFLLLLGMLTPFADFYFVAILISVLKTSLWSFTDLSYNNTIRFMNPDGFSNSGQMGDSGSNNPDGSSNSGQIGGSGSNTTDGSSNSGSNTTNQEVQNFDGLRRATGSKLRNIYVNRPPRTKIWMTELEYANRITPLDHNIVCRAILDCGSDLRKFIDHRDGIWYRGYITLELLHILER